MPTYTITDPQNGRKVRITGDSPPTEAEINQIFAAQVQAPKAVQAKPVAQNKAENGWNQAPAEFRGYDSDRGTIANTPSNKINEFVGAATHNFAKAGLVPGQWLSRGLALTGIPALEDRADSYDSFMRNFEQDYQDRTPDSGAAYTGAFVGNAATMLSKGALGGIEAIGNYAKFAPQATNVAGKVANFVTSRGAQGAVLGATQPVVNGDFWAEKAKQVALGAGLGVAIPLGLKGAEAAWNKGASIYQALKNPSSAAGKKIMETYGLTVDDIPKLLEQAPFAGYKQSIAEKMVGTPKAESAAMVEKSLGNTPTFAYEREMSKNDNNESIINVIKKIAGTPDEQKALRDARTNATGDFYQANVTNITPRQRYTNASKAVEDAQGKRMSSADFDSLNQVRIIANRVASKKMTEAEASDALKLITVESKTANKALEQARANMRKNMVNQTNIFKFVEKGETEVSDTIKALSGRVINDLRNKADSEGYISTKDLHLIKQQLSAKVNELKKSGASFGVDEYKYITQLQAKITNAFERAIPGYRANNSTYAELSKPINTAKGAQKILDEAVNSPNARVDSRGNATLTPDSINKYLLKDGKAQYGLGADARQQLEAIQSTLRQRTGTQGALKTPGSDTALNGGLFAKLLSGEALANPTAGALSGSTLAGLLSLSGAPGVGLAIAGSLLGKGAQVANQRVASQTAKGAYDSAEAAKMIQSYLAKNPSQSQQLLAKYPQWRRILVDNSKQLEKP